MSLCIIFLSLHNVGGVPLPQENDRGDDKRLDVISDDDQTREEDDLVIIEDVIDKVGEEAEDSGDSEEKPFDLFEGIGSLMGGFLDFVTGAVEEVQKVAEDPVST